MQGMGLGVDQGRPVLSQPQKAAIIVRLLVAEGANIPIASLPEEVQTALTEQIAQLRMIDRDTLAAVVEEFCDSLEAVGLSFPDGLDGALSMLEAHLSPPAASRLRRMAASSSRADPWERISGLAVEQILPVIEEESIEVAAVVLSKLSVSKAAELLAKLPGERARRIAYAVSLTGNVAPDTVRRIGQALFLQLDSVPAKEFDSGPVERVGAILNFSPANTRDEVLKGLEEDDATFAEQVRKAIFTFTNIPARIDARDIPKVLRSVDQAVLVKALAGATGANAKSAEFILSNISQRLATSIRDEIAGLGKVKEKDAEEAMSTIVAAIREMETNGEIFLVANDEEE